MSNALARKFRIDVTTDLTLAGSWVQLNGISDFDPGIAEHLEDAMAYDTNGLPSMEPTAYDAAPVVTFLRRYSGGATYDPGQEIVRLASSLQFGSAARCGVRWYDKFGGPETGQALVLPNWKRSQSGVRNLEAVTSTLQVTDGTLTLNFANPGTAATVPLVLSATPSGQSAAKPLTLTGQSFLGTTGITVGGVAVAAGAFTVQSDNLIVLVMPAGSAGSAPIIVTNAVGAGASFPYTRA